MRLIFLGFIAIVAMLAFFGSLSGLTMHYVLVLDNASIFTEKSVATFWKAAFLSMTMLFASLAIVPSKS